MTPVPHLPSSIGHSSSAIGDSPSAITPLSSAIGDLPSAIIPITPPFQPKAKIIPAKDSLLLPFQTKWIQDRSLLKLAVKSRQIGWTWATAYSLVRRKSQKSARQDAWITSRDEIQAQLFLEDCKHFLEYLKIVTKTIKRRQPKNGGHTVHTLQFIGGRRIHSLSSNPDAQAGKRGDRILDEFALHPDPHKLYAIAYPGITWGGSLEIFSTHRGTDNYFNTLIKEIQHGGNPKNFSFHQVTLQDALDQGLLYKLQQKLPQEDPRQQMDEPDYFNFIRQSCPDEETFQQEYLCQPSDDQSAFIPYDLIAACEYPADEIWESSHSSLSTPHSALFLGIDLGRDHDLTVFWLMEKVADVFYTRRVITLKGQSFDAQEKAFDDLLSLPTLQRCCIDQTGLGRQFAERAQQRFGKYKVEGINFTGPIKEQLAYPVRAALEGKTIRIPNDPHIRADLRAIKKETTTSGHIRFTADRGRNGHADRFWALALALYAGKTQQSCGATIG